MLTNLGVAAASIVIGVTAAALFLMGHRVWIRIRRNGGTR